MYDKWFRVVIRERTIGKTRMVFVQADMPHTAIKKITGLSSSTKYVNAYVATKLEVFAASNDDDIQVEIKKDLRI